MVSRPDGAPPIEKVGAPEAVGTRERKPVAPGASFIDWESDIFMLAEKDAWKWGGDVGSDVGSRVIMGGWRRGEGRTFIEIDLALDGRRSPSLAEGSICNMRVSGTSLSAAAASRGAQQSAMRQRERRIDW